VTVLASAQSSLSANLHASYFTSYVERPSSSNPSGTSCYSARRTIISATKLLWTISRISSTPHNNTKWLAMDLTSGVPFPILVFAIASRNILGTIQSSTPCPFALKKRDCTVKHLYRTPSSVMFVAWDSCPQYPFMVLSVVTGNSDHIFMKYVSKPYLNSIILCVVSEYKIK
jgi:hypothetical protein